jgi:hypothetical protein
MLGPFALTVEAPVRYFGQGGILVASEPSKRCWATPSCNYGASWTENYMTIK